MPLCESLRGSQGASVVELGWRLVSWGVELLLKPDVGVDDQLHAS